MQACRSLNVSLLAFWCTHERGLEAQHSSLLQHEGILYLVMMKLVLDATFGSKLWNNHVDGRVPHDGCGLL